MSASNTTETAASPALTPLDIYNDLCSALRSRNFHEPLAVEVLLESHSLPPGVTILIDENTIGIPKKSLVKAFLAARQIFLENRDAINEKQQVILDASAVMLFFDPEHLTAANARKRIILNQRRHAIDESQRTIELDLWFTAGLLTSFLSRHTKSPTLWSHRRWLLQQTAPLPESQQLREPSVVALMAAEHHPRNYYAWDYMRWWASTHDAINLFGQSSEIASHVLREHSNLPVVVGFYLSWCLKHPSDTSGWSFLLWLLTCSSLTLSPDIGPLKSRVITKVLAVVKSLGFRNESLWEFLRTAITMDDTSPDLQRIYREQKRDMSL